MTMIDLRSDTKTRPTPAMREAIAGAKVGDEQAFEDPTTTELEARVAALLHKQAAVFLPSGTMANAISYRLHIRPGGDEVVLARGTHTAQAEAGGPAALSGAMTWPIDGDRGMFGADELQAVLMAHRQDNRHAPRPRLVSLEQATGRGTVWPLQRFDAVLKLAREYELRVHLDGARLMNAAVASGLEPSRFVEGVDTAWIDFSKGLGAPVGAVLVGSKELIEEAWRFKQMFGGAMRQSGMLAAGCLYALDHHVSRLAEDHANAKLLAEGLAKVPGVVLDLDEIETNIVFFSVERAPAFVVAMAEHGVLMGHAGGNLVRAVTHLDVDQSGIDKAVELAGTLSW